MSLVYDSRSDCKRYLSGGAMVCGRQTLLSRLPRLPVGATHNYVNCADCDTGLRYKRDGQGLKCAATILKYFRHASRARTSLGSFLILQNTRPIQIRGRCDIRSSNGAIRKVRKYAISSGICVAQPSAMLPFFTQDRSDSTAQPIRG
jgi:hypothetical protein